MNALYAFVVVLSLFLGLVSLMALASRRLRRKAAIYLGYSLAALVVSLILYVPDKPNADQATTDQNQATAQAIPSDAKAAVPTNFWLPQLVAGSPGIARICLIDDDINLRPGTEITLPATTVFEDKGPNIGKQDDPASWNDENKDFFHAAIVTLAPVVFRSQARCADTTVKMLTDSSWKEASQRASDHHVFTITDVLDYPIPTIRPPVEIGKLIDDISVKAIIISDVRQATEVPEHKVDDATKAAICLDAAKKLAAYVGAGVGRQTSMVVFLGKTPSAEASYGCEFGPKNTSDLYVAWEGNARPPKATKAFIAKAGEFLTGAPRAELDSETNSCVTDALKPDANEIASREFRGVKIECQAFRRNGGGGSVTVYRRFGVGPDRPNPPAAAMAAMNRASDAIKIEDERSAADTLKFTEWFQDPTIPKEVKTFAMLAARVTTLAERCPNAGLYDDKIAKWAAWAGIETSEIQPGGRYASLMTKMMVAMRKGAAKEGVEEACEEIKKYE